MQWKAVERGFLTIIRRPMVCNGRCYITNNNHFKQKGMAGGFAFHNKPLSLERNLEFDRSEKAAVAAGTRLQSAKFFDIVIVGGGKCHWGLVRSPTDTSVRKFARCKMREK
jgi:hypothetical protein